VAIISDIQQAFLQTSLDRKDRDLTRFLWYRISQDDEGNRYTTNEVETYRFTRLPFGLACSPLLLSAALREQADRQNGTFPTAAPLVDRNTFMDDFDAGTENDNGAITIYYELTSLMKMINSPLAKWARISEQLKAIWRAEGQDTEVQTDVLGVRWNTETDCSSFDTDATTRKLPESPTTKRQLANYR